MSNFLCNCNFIAEIGKHKTCSSIKQTHLLKYKSTMNHWIINQFNFYAVYQGLPWLLKGTQWQPFLLCQFLSRTNLGLILLSSVRGGEILYPFWPLAYFVTLVKGFIGWPLILDKIRNASGLQRWLVRLGCVAGDQTAAGRCTQFASWAQQKQIWGLCLYVSQKCAKPTFCVCILLYLFIIIANVYFNVQISAKYTTHNSTILNFGIILKR